MFYSYINFFLLLQALFPEAVNVEKTTENSSPQTFYVFSTLSTVSSDFIEVNTSIPIHMRYHEPRKNQEYVFITLKNPELWIRCEGQ